MQHYQAAQDGEKTAALVGNTAVAEFAHVAFQHLALDQQGEIAERLIQEETVDLAVPGWQAGTVTKKDAHTNIHVHNSQTKTVNNQHQEKATSQYYTCIGKGAP